MQSESEWVEIIVADATESLLWHQTTFADDMQEPVPTPSTLPPIFDLGFDNPVAAIYRFVEHRRLIGFDQLDDPKAFSEVSSLLWAIYSKMGDDQRKRFLYLGDNFQGPIRKQHASTQ